MIFTKLYKFLFHKRKPELMDRLSHLIVIQVFFVFSALLIIILYPKQDLSSLEKNNLMLKSLNSFSDYLNRGLENYNTDSNLEETGTIVEGILKKSFQSNSDIRYAKLYFQNKTNSSISYYYQSDLADNPQDPDNVIIDEIDNMPKLTPLNSENSQIVELEIENNYIVYAYNFKLVTGDTALLMVAVKHNFLLFNKTTFLWAILLLFLGTVLTALLMIYLLSNKFKKPYQRLVLGLEKTASGNMYYHLESTGGKELIRLVKASNTLSSRLWDDHKKIEDYTLKLRDAGISLRESQSLLGVIIDNSQVGIITADSNGSIMVYNKKASELFEYKKDDIINMNISDLFQNAKDNLSHNQTQQNDEDGFEILCRAKTGNLFPAYIISSPIMNHDDRVVAHLYMIRDISESKKFQEMMIRLDRYYIKGKMAGDVAHEINNYLAVLSGNLELMPSYIESRKYDKIKSKLGLMQEAVENISRFSERLIESDSDNCEIKKIDLNQLIENVTAFLKPQNRFDGIRFRTNLTEKMPYIEIDETQIQQVLVNLIENAGEAVANMTDNKEIEISSTVFNREAQEFTEIIIKDNGPGVSDDKLSLMFIKRFTTRPRGRGMGLITCRKITEGHGGTISYSYNNGATIRIVLPIKMNYKTMDKPHVSRSPIFLNA